MPAAPALFSITTVWPSSFESGSLIMRPTISVVPPGAAGIIMVIDLFGQLSCAIALSGKQARPAIAKRLISVN